jgi:AcrR family transcriptional regulator
MPTPIPPIPPTPTSQPPLRADARRNHDAVIAAALRLLAADPEATMREVADASGLTRTTVYRHFPSREDLLRAIVDVVACEVDAAALAATAGDPPLAQVAAAVARSSVALGRRFGFLSASDVGGHEAATAGDAAMMRWLTVARERGEVRDDMPPAWQLRLVRAVAASAAGAHADGETTAAEAELLLARTLVTLLAAPR